MTTMNAVWEGSSNSPPFTAKPARQRGQQRMLRRQPHNHIPSSTTSPIPRSLSTTINRSLRSLTWMTTIVAMIVTGVCFLCNDHYLVTPITGFTILLPTTPPTPTTTTTNRLSNMILKSTSSVDTFNTTASSSSSSVGGIGMDGSASSIINDIFTSSKNNNNNNIVTAKDDLSSSSLPPLSDEEREELKRQCAEAIERVVSGGVTDLNKLRDDFQQRNLDQKRLEDAMMLNHIIQERALDEKMEQIIGDFLADTQNERDKTHRLFEEDEVKRRIEAKKEEEKLKPKPLKPWDMTNNEYDQWDGWDDDTWSW